MLLSLHFNSDLTVFTHSKQSALMKLLFDTPQHAHMYFYPWVIKRKYETFFILYCDFREAFRYGDGETITTQQLGLPSPSQCTETETLYLFIFQDSALQQSACTACPHCIICYIESAQGRFSLLNPDPANPTFLTIFSLFHPSHSTAMFLCRWGDLLPAACVQHYWAGEDLSIS